MAYISHCWNIQYLTVHQPVPCQSQEKRYHQSHGGTDAVTNISSHFIQFVISLSLSGIMEHVVWVGYSLSTMMRHL